MTKIIEELPKDFLDALKKIDPEMFEWFKQTVLETLNSDDQMRVYKLKRDKSFRDAALDDSFNETKNTILDTLFLQLNEALNFTDKANIRNSLNYDRITCEALLTPLLMKIFIDQLKTESDISKRNFKILSFQVSPEFLQELNKSETQQKLAKGELGLSFENVSILPVINIGSQPSENNDYPNNSILKQQYVDDKKATMILINSPHYLIHDPLNISKRQNNEQIIPSSMNPTDPPGHKEQFELNH